MTSPLKTEAEYKQVMAEIETFLQKATHNEGFTSLSPEETERLRNLSLQAEAYEDAIPIMPLQIPTPQTLSDMLSLKMFQLKLKQKDLAALLDITPTRLSEVMTGKRKVNMDLAKRLYQKLAIDPAFILEHA
ncbi:MULTISPECIES: helix-turn-helix domain-containing protein [Runella]|uniref:HTH-type transcriptional regulator/antitoxin HigA n=1 Tax=Runella defluvii TaxID=370973 RepID=A0A7W5ZN19_9BACT|nr:MULTISPECIES: helix-turn-helix domain-containing protein [Runella]AYQ34674.1 helix-turn-helix domain-containing protein [Runella sp. SP2]MBB3840427.1 HTH-type transcriptional regulator/antitoxin HigA [Runella defluvii]